MNIIKAEQVHIREAVELAKREYEMERVSSPQLIDKNFEGELTELITQIFKNPYSYVAVEQEKVMGYLGFWNAMDGFFGNCKGVFSPLGASAFGDGDRDKLASKLLSHAMQSMVEDGITSIALSRYAHDEEVGRGLVLNGFGIRCSDAIMDLGKVQDNEKFMEKENDHGIRYEELEKSEFQKVVELRKGLTLHLLHAPTCFPTSLEDFFDHMEERLQNRIFAAKDQDEIVGFIELTEEDGETFISEDESMYNICGTYVNPEYRNGDVARQILTCLVHKLQQEGVAYLGVDCETLNPTALRFWGKYFEAYTYSYHRRLDERVIGYDKYYHGFWKERD